MEWAVNSVATYKDILKMVKQAGQGNKSAEANKRQTSLKAILRDFTKVFLQGFVSELPIYAQDFVLGSILEQSKKID